MLPKLLTAITFSVSACLLSMTAHANQIELDGYPGKSVFDIDCSPSCEGFFVDSSPSDLTLSVTDASAYTAVWTESQQLAALNVLLSQLDTTRTPATYANKTIGPASTFTTNQHYLSLYKWNGSGKLWFFENTSGGDLTVTALGPDWAHSTEYGAVSAVPVPAAAWLFGSALLAILTVARRKKISTDAA
jgi:hypothetical protein